MVRARAIAISLSFMLVVLAACAGRPSAPSFPPFSFADRPPIALDVAAIEVENRYRPPLKEPNVEHQFPVTPAQAAESWAHDRLRAAGAGGIARFIILDASAVEEALPTTTGVRGAFTRDQAERYTAVLHVRLEVEKPDRMASAFVEATARRSRTVAENVTLNERDQAFYELTKELIHDLDQQLEGSIRSNLKGYLVP